MPIREYERNADHETTTSEVYLRHISQAIEELTQVLRARPAAPQRPLFVWLTGLDYHGKPLPKRATAVASILDIAPGVAVNQEDWSSTTDDNRKPTIRSYTPGATLTLAGSGGQEGYSTTWNVQEDADTIVLLCEGASLPLGRRVAEVDEVYERAMADQP